MLPLIGSWLPSGSGWPWRVRPQVVERIRVIESPAAHVDRRAGVAPFVISGDVRKASARRVAYTVGVCTAFHTPPSRTPPSQNSSSFPSLSRWPESRGL